MVYDLRKKKQEATRLKTKTAKQLQESRSLEKRSSSGLNNINRKIESQKQDISDVSETLNQKTAQIESIERLISTAHDRLEQEKEAISQIEQEIEFATEDEKEHATSRLQLLQNHVSELESEIKIRENTAKKIADEIAKFSEIKSKMTQKVKKHAQSKPKLRETMISGHKKAKILANELEQQIKTEDSIQKALEKANLRLDKSKSKPKTKSAKPTRKSKLKKSSR